MQILCRSRSALKKVRNGREPRGRSHRPMALSVQTRGLERVLSNCQDGMNSVLFGMMGGQPDRNVPSSLNSPGREQQARSAELRTQLAGGREEKAADDDDARSGPRAPRGSPANLSEAGGGWSFPEKGSSS